jgi:hypothetical protein
MNPNDKVRSQILCYFYDRNKNATSQHGKKGSAVKISDAKRELKDQHGLTQQQVVSNLTYLIDKGWINKTEVEKTVMVRGGSVPSTVTWYEISSAGIDKIEGESEFKANHRFSGINITATGQNIIALGDGNIVNARYADLRKELDHLSEAVVGSPKLQETEKLDLVTDIETIKDQLVKSQPNRSIIRELWGGVDKAVTAAGFVDLVRRVAPLLEGLLF